MSGHPNPCGHLRAARVPALRRRLAGGGAGRHYLSSCVLLYAATGGESVRCKAGALVAAARDDEIDGDPRQRRIADVFWNTATVLARNVPPALPPLRVDIAGFGAWAMPLPIVALDLPTAMD
ncbi:hypothetical protein ACFQGW_10250 [Xanthomonas theicola]|nr:hypothetical protein [Xanthomonas theicola]QNH26758.1 hypothetical protein G4Q83_21390 [Xanthomonas theicola]